MGVNENEIICGGEGGGEGGRDDGGEGGGEGGRDDGGEGLLTAIKNVEHLR